ncbi:hypothetical protein RFI_39789, partial [Reticulomyxa filosa]
MDRDQQKMALYLYDTTKDFKSIEEKEKDKKKHGEPGICLFEYFGTPWINYHDSYYFGKHGAIWSLEPTGFLHLYYIPYPSSESSSLGSEVGAKKHVTVVEMKDADLQRESNEEEQDNTSPYGSHPTKVNMTLRTPLVSQEKVL